jgi:ATP-dependent Clp protease adaptor protein ClpS
MADGGIQLEERQADLGTDLERPWNVILHNDDIHDMEYVVRALMKTIARMTAERAVEIMLEAHTKGKAIAATERLEMAEAYCDGLGNHGLLSTLEKA